jgi:class 3 adenylate cyclase
VTFMLTDVEGSTKRWEADSAAMTKAMAQLDQAIEETVENGGQATSVRASRPRLRPGHRYR